MKFSAKFKSVYDPCILTGYSKINEEISMTKSLVRTDAGGRLKVLATFVLVATQCITVTPGIRGQAQSPLIIEIPSLAGRSMGDIIQQIKAPKKCKEFDKEFL